MPFLDIFISVKTSHIYDYCADAVAAVPTMTQESAQLQYATSGGKKWLTVNTMHTFTPSSLCGNLIIINNCGFC